MSHQIVNLSWVGLDLEYPLVFEVFPRCWAATVATNPQQED